MIIQVLTSHMRSGRKTLWLVFVVNRRCLGRRRASLKICLLARRVCTGSGCDRVKSTSINKEVLFLRFSTAIDCAKLKSLYKEF